jgi:hypothetical protein
MTRSLAQAAVAAVLAALLVGPSAHAGTPTPGPAAKPAYGHRTNEWLMMGRNCGASIS